MQNGGGDGGRERERDRDREMDFYKEKLWLFIAAVCPAVLLMKAASDSVIYPWGLLRCLIKSVWHDIRLSFAYSVWAWTSAEAGSWFEFICLNAFLDPSRIFSPSDRGPSIYSVIHYPVGHFLLLWPQWHAHLMCMSLWSQGPALYAGTCLPCFPPRSSQPREQGHYFSKFN